MLEYKIITTSSHQERPASAGERVFFFATLEANSKKVMSGTMHWKISFNGFQKIAEGSYSTGEFTPDISCVCDRPGWYFCKFEAFDHAEKVQESRIGVIADPGKLMPALPVPGDFDSFWEKQLERLASVPANPRWTKLESSLYLETYDLQADCVNHVPVSGIFVKPANAQKGKHPAILLPHGAGVRSSVTCRTPGYAARGFLALDLNAHGHPNGKLPEWYKNMEEKLGAYYKQGFREGDPEKCYMTDVFLRLVRALEILSSLPEWDGKNLWISGGSQAAWQALAGAYLMKKVSGIAVWIPAGCDICHGGWPCYEYNVKTPSEEVKHAVSYLDGCAFASKLSPELPVFWSMGLIDEVCKPQCVSAAYNVLRVKDLEKDVHFQMCHETIESMVSRHDLFIMKRLKK